MKLRSIPYGYEVKNGENHPHPNESKVIRNIFTEYIGGKSYQIIAKTLTDEGILFLPGRSDWNKNRVKRIIEDIRYTGTDTYPTIINVDVFQRVQVIKDSNNKQQNNKSELPFRLYCPVECHCGSKMIRRRDTRRKASIDYWKCTNPECRFVSSINDDMLLLEITEIMNYLIKNPTLIRVDSPAEPEPTIEVRRLGNDVCRLLDSVDFDKDNLKAIIFALAAEKYRQLENSTYISHILRAEFEQRPPLSCFSEELFRRTVHKIQFNNNSRLVLIMKNNQNIRKEPDHADSNDACHVGTGCPTP